MRNRATHGVLQAASFLMSLAATLQPALAQTSPTETTPHLKIAGAVPSPLTLKISDLKSLPRTTLHVVNPHQKKQEVYEGVLLEELLRKAGVPHGEQLRGPLRLVVPHDKRPARWVRMLKSITVVSPQQ